jgi:tripartite-type tricarboxylate transporter receptor subunit TctC
MKRPFASAAVVFASLICAVPSQTQAATVYPNRPVRMIVPFAPGGASDFVGRIIYTRLGSELGNQQVVIDNRTGAAGNIGVEIAARATPDGYTILLGNSGTMAINPGLFPKFPIRPTRDLIAITQVVDVPGALVVHPSVPVTSVKEFITYAKARPEKLNYGSAGAGSPQRLSMEYFMSQAGIKLLHVPYKGGAGAAAIAVVAGEVSAVMTSVPAVLPHAKSGKLKLLSVVSPKRLVVSPETPTMVESGFPAMTAGAWQGLYAPTGTPHAIINQLFAAATKTMADPEVGKRLATGSAEIITSKSLEEFAKFTKSENELWVKLIKDISVVGE